MLTKFDILKLALPIAGGLFCFAAGIAYAVYKTAGSAVYSFIAVIMCSIIFYDVWVFHRWECRGVLAQEHTREGPVILKICFAVFVIVLTAIAAFVLSSFASRVQHFDSSEPIWLAITCIVAIIWAIDLGLFHFRKPNNTVELPEVNSSQPTTTLEEPQATN